MLCQILDIRDADDSPLLAYLCHIRPNALINPYVVRFSLAMSWTLTIIEEPTLCKTSNVVSSDENLLVVIFLWRS